MCPSMFTLSIYICVCVCVYVCVCVCVCVCVFIYIHVYIFVYVLNEHQAKLVELLRINIVTRADVSEEPLPTGTKKKKIFFFIKEFFRIVFRIFRIVFRIFFLFCACRSPYQAVTFPFTPMHTNNLKTKSISKSKNWKKKSSFTLSSGYLPLHSHADETPPGGICGRHPTKSTIEENVTLSLTAASCRTR